MCVTIDQDDYAAQLNPVDTLPVNMESEHLLKQLLPESFKAQFLSLLGGLSWLLQTRLDAAVYVQALQRNAQTPRYEHLVRLNKVCKWVRRTKASIFFQKLTPPCKILVVSDAAFRKEDKSGLAMRGALIALCEQRPNSPGGKWQILEYYSRKQRRVTRSTFAAELHAVADALELGRMIGYAMTELLLESPPDAAEILRREETGRLSMPLEATVDCRSVWDALKLPEVRVPSEITLVMVLHQLKEHLQTGTIGALWWVDTRDCVVDGLTKGAIGRRALLLAASAGEWLLNYAALRHTEPSSAARQLQGAADSIYRPAEAAATMHTAPSASSSSMLIYDLANSRACSTWSIAN